MEILIYMAAILAALILNMKIKKEQQQEREHQCAERLLLKYEKMRQEMVIMDDYDGGQAESLDMIIEDLRKSMWWTI